VWLAKPTIPGDIETVGSLTKRVEEQDGTTECSTPFSLTKMYVPHHHHSPPLQTHSLIPYSPHHLLIRDPSHHKTPRCKISPPHPTTATPPSQPSPSITTPQPKPNPPSQLPEIPLTTPPSPPQPPPQQQQSHKPPNHPQPSTPHPETSQSRPFRPPSRKGSRSLAWYLKWDSNHLRCWRWAQQVQPQNWRRKEDEERED